ncbi:MAG: hypothetical protein HZA27_01655 [Candidatus Omnitrophica bacterium]|nr:hypothetical protein [Candidatus Omnitrophota bacterium]
MKRLFNVKCVMFNVVLLYTLHFTHYTVCYAAPCYGTKLPEKNKIFLGVQTHSIFKRYLIAEEGKLRSWQDFLLLSYGVFDWLSLDLKGGAGYIKEHPIGSDELDYPSSFAGGYGFRLKFYETQRIKAVFGFQHISVHPRAINVGSTKHKAVLDDWQFSLLCSYDFKKIVPYLGLRWSRIDYIHWQDESRKRVKSDRTKSAGLIAGFDLPITKNLWLNLEGNFLDSQALAASLNYSF